jgi:predicted RNase H-like nuclease
MPWIAGVDGCKAGWIAALQDLETHEFLPIVAPSFQEIAHGERAPVLTAVDMPIGLAQRGPRQCDIEARALLGARGASVFPAPPRPLLQTTSYAQANALYRKLMDGKGLSRQSYNLIGKVREVDRAVRAAGRQNGQSAPALGLPIRECHPELAFLAMNGGQPLPASKHEAAGLELRRLLLERELGVSLREFVLATRRWRGVALDDVYDALACLWSAQRMLAGMAQRVPADPPADRFGLPMEINY